MKNVCVITGGGSGMGFATAKLMCKDHHVIITGRDKEKLESAAKELNKIGGEVDIFSCDVSDRNAVRSLAEYASKKGTVKSVIHVGGVSPAMAGEERIFDINALGTIYVNEEFSAVMEEGGCIVDIASMSAYLVPLMLKEPLPKEDYKLALSDKTKFKEKLMSFVNSYDGVMKGNVAYAVSKDFVIWYAAKCAYLYGKKNIRVLSVSPGTFETPMGKKEGAAAAEFARKGALGRMGQPEEMAELLAFVAGDGASYLTGTDILCDGGSMAAIKNA